MSKLQVTQNQASSNKNIDGGEDVFVFPMAYSQKRIWLLNQFQQDSSIYNISTAVRFTGLLHISALEQAVKEIVRRHEILRTRFTLFEGEPAQIISTEISASLSLVDLRDCSIEQQTIEVRSLESQEAQYSFDLEQEPLLRVILVQLSDQSHELLVTMHHIITDGWSMGVFFHELATFYQAFIQGHESTLQPLSIQYADFAEWQLERLSDAKDQNPHAEYWRKNLQDAPSELGLPTDHLRPEAQNWKGNVCEISLPDTLINSLMSLGREQGVTIFNTLLSIFKILMFRWTQQEDIVVGTVVAGRNSGDLQNLIGCFINFIALRSQLTIEQTGLEVLAQVQRSVIKSFEHQDYPFEKVVEVVNPERKFNQNPIYNVAFLYQNFPTLSSFNENLDAQYNLLNNQTSQLDLKFEVYSNTGKTLLRCEYDSDLFERETIEYLLQGYRQVVETFTDNPSSRVSAFTLPEQLISRAEVSVSRRLLQRPLATFSIPPNRSVIAPQTPTEIGSTLIARLEETLQENPAIQEFVVVVQDKLFQQGVAVSTQQSEDFIRESRYIEEDIESKQSIAHSIPFSDTLSCQVDEIATSIHFDTWADLLPGTSRNAILGIDGRKPLTHESLKAFVLSPPDNANLNILGIHSTDRVCVAIPNGPEAAVAFLSLAQQCVYAPISLSLTENQLCFELEDLGAVALVLQRSQDNSSVNNKFRASAKKLGVQVIELVPDASVCGLFILREERSENISNNGQQTTIISNKPTRDSVALVLHTSGTTKRPKTVPLTHKNLTSGALAIARTLNLTPDDTCINIMPLFHIHGISVNVLASVLAGAGVICTPGLYTTESNVSDFFQYLNSEDNENRVTWYSAVPTMHQEILVYAEQMIDECGTAPLHSLRFIRNCSAALLPTIAERMAAAFNCEILPTYAMTESMPICSPDIGHGLTKRGSVGRAAGPNVIIGDTKEIDGVSVLSIMPSYVEGEVMVKGACVTSGYEFRDWMDTDPNHEAFVEGWLRTGDKGYMDEEGYVYLVGRFKEIINRAGEKISPLLIEDILLQHPAVSQVMVFAAPHELLGEVVGAAIVLPPENHSPRPSLEELRHFVAMQKELEPQWLPECLVWTSVIPKGPTGKPARIKFAERLGLPVISADVKKALRTFVATAGEGGKFMLETIDTQISQIEHAEERYCNSQEMVIYFTTETPQFSMNYLLQELEANSCFHDLNKLMACIFVQLETLPLTPEGTVDHEQLYKISKNVSHNPKDGKIGFVPPQTERQFLITRLLAEVLSLPVEKIGIHDGFFELGGHSLLATQLVARLQDMFGVELSLRTLFQSPTVAELDAIIETTLSKSPVGELDKLNNILDKIESLSDEEIEALSMS
jgi:acyl-CoA synthetase (AMP-forming)/AMP-acid ligase II/acyl carrier protein